MTTTWRSTPRSTRRSSDKVGLTSRWVQQWAEAVQQGASCELQKNTLVSPLHDTLKQHPPDDYHACGYFFKPDQHTGDMAAMIALLQKTGVRVYRLDTPVAVNGYHEYGNSPTRSPRRASTA